MGRVLATVVAFVRGVARDTDQRCSVGESERLFGDAVRERSRCPVVVKDVA